MLPFFRPKNEKDLSEKLLGKLKKFRLTRNGSTVAVSGKLLGLYRRAVTADGLMPPAAGRVELFVVILTKAGRYFLYYIVTYPETEDIAGRQEYAHLCDDLDAVRSFLGAMLYPDKQRFVDAVLEQVATTLSPPVAKGRRSAKKTSPQAEEPASASLPSGDVSEEAFLFDSAGTQAPEEGQTEASTTKDASPAKTAAPTEPSA